MTTTEPRKIAVAAYRNMADHLYRLARVDYPACKGERELDYWAQIAKGTLDEKAGVVCPTAKKEDIARMLDATNAVLCCLATIPPKGPSGNPQSKLSAVIDSGPTATNGKNPYMAFYLMCDAVEHRSQHGGWLFESDEGGPLLWFNREFTPSTIMTHPITKGLSGKLL